MNHASHENSELTPRIRSIEASHIVDMMHIAAETKLSHWSAQNYLEEIKNPDAIMLRLVSDNNSMVGFVVGRLVPGGNIDMQIDAEIYNIAVTYDEQNRGHGQLLFDAFSECCRQRNAVQIWLEVRQSNHNAIAFYEKNGFMQVQTRNHFYDDPREHALLMKLDLKKGGA